MEFVFGENLEKFAKDGNVTAAEALNMLADEYRKQIGLENEMVRSLKKIDPKVVVRVTTSIK